MSTKDTPSELIRAKDVSAFDRWALPSFDAEIEQAVAEDVPAASETAEPSEASEIAQSEEVPLEAVKPLTLDELEAIRQDAYNEGLATGEKDGFRAGQLRAKQEADVALAAKLGSLESVMQQLFEPIAEQDLELERMLVNLVSHMARQVIQRELVSDSSQIRHVLREALKLLPMGAGNIRIHINPQDFAVVKALRDRHEESWRILEDEALLPGGCRIETEHSRIDASIETRLNQAIQQLFEQQREQAVHPLPADIGIDLGAESGSREAAHAS
ncbi:flagellar assembly protein FliH [Pseudomonas sp. LS44]|uniref:flagellar assembly protein FliH n=1 Tax=Pseudomonas sp. LS44 TaxID=1357074 RepID=UPI00215B5BD2|nr:flagellar assembly protein FliH [Pseudomonas sp. LS44]UVE16374.1 flagellar assembly protein FliH [Pseudomonas sp. LS44]